MVAIWDRAKQPQTTDVSLRRRGPRLGSRLRGRTRRCALPFRRSPTCCQIAHQSPIPTRHPSPAVTRSRPPPRHPSESWDLPDRVATLANRDTPASAGATSGVRSNRSKCRRRTRIPVRIRMRIRLTITDVKVSPRQSCYGRPGTASRRRSPSRRLSYITPICQRRIMIQALLPHRSVERRRPDLGASRATPEATPTNQNIRASDRHHAACQPPGRSCKTPHKSLHQRLHVPHFAFPA